MADLVYPYTAAENKWQDNELRFSLRSVEKHMLNYRHVFIVGDRPSFLSEEIIHIPNTPNHFNKARNIMENVLAACLDDRVSDEFMLLNNDYFLTAPIDADAYPYYYKCELSHTVRIQQNEYRKHVIPTIAALQGRGLPILNFDTHYPILYDKKKMIEVVSTYDWERLFGYVLKSLYCNTLGIIGEFRLDCKSYHARNRAYWEEFIRDKEIFSTADECLNGAFKGFLADLYPERSRFETI